MSLRRGRPARLRPGLRQHGRERRFLERRAAAAGTASAQDDNRRDPSLLTPRTQNQRVLGTPIRSG